MHIKNAFLANDISQSFFFPANQCKLSNTIHCYITSAKWFKQFETNGKLIWSTEKDGAEIRALNRRCGAPVNNRGIPNIHGIANQKHRSTEVMMSNPFDIQPDIETDTE